MRRCIVFVSYLDEADYYTKLQLMVCAFQGYEHFEKFHHKDPSNRASKLW